jgi:HK97 family phage major capsid protein
MTMHIGMRELLAILAESPRVYFNDANTIQALKDRLCELQERANTIKATADAAKRDFTAEDASELQDIFDQIDHTRGDIDRRERIEANNAAIFASEGRKTESSEPPAAGDDATPGKAVQTIDANPNARNAVRQPPHEPRRSVPAQPRNSDYLRHGFRSMGDFACAVVNASGHPGTVDPRLQFAAGPGTFGSEGVGADGGFAVPPEFRTTIMEKVLGEASLLGRTDLIDVAGNSITIPKDETTAWQTSGGILATWEGEGAQIAQTRPLLEDVTVKLNKLTALVPVTNELLEDAAALASYINRKAPEKIDFKVNLAIIAGTGVGQPLGILNSPALISVAKTTSQATATVNHANIITMWARLYGPARQNAVWLINQDVEPQLNALGFPTGGTTVQFPIYIPPGGVSGAPYSTLLGKPVIPTQACSTVGTQGDIILTDLKAYLAAQKVGGLRAETSIHLWFDYDITAFRFILRIAGQPWWSSAISPLNGSNTMSHYVTLDARP